MKKESVWDYPRPPKLEDFSGHIRIIHQGLILADSNSCKRVLETSHPPTYYIPFGDINQKYLKPTDHRTYCEFKGQAAYFDLLVNDNVIQNVGWYYPKPNLKFESIKDHVCFYPSKLDTCLVNDEKVKAQEGDFYGGWITSNIVGPFKGGPGTWGW
jgi:uncharacterized protein (DUF427 family)